MKPRFETSPDIDACVAYLRKHEARPLIEYAELSEAIKRDIAGRDRHILQSARRRLEKEGIVFVVATGKGVRRATDAQVAILATDTPIRKTKRITKTAHKRQRTVNVQNLSQEQLAAFYVGRAVLGAIEQATRKAFRTKIINATNTESGPLPLKETLEMFKGLRPNGRPPQ